MCFKIREARKAAVITQEELAKALGINRATLSRYESGAIDPPSSQLQRIASALGVSVDYLIGKTDDPYGLRRTMSATAGFDGSASATVDPTTAISPRARISAGLDKLNDKGQCVAADRVEELTKIPDYQKPKNPPEGR